MEHQTLPVENLLMKDAKNTFLSSTVSTGSQNPGIILFFVHQSFCFVDCVSTLAVFLKCQYYNSYLDGYV